ncbi:MAG: type IV secretion system protein [Campylobacter sp.]|uniref:virB8 family protein n=1 Tax=Campylobacter sp. TaxID=205 RepID=UPI002A91F800|nr:type IV secretion system protein [Campylobacter sp.]MDY5888138.1 type IV secretion system protein [Campylobacter sp.]
MVAFFSVIVALASVLAVSFLTPLKTVEPYVIRVDNVTGMVDILTTLNEEKITSNEALDKHFITQYVKAREGYYYDMLNKDYVLVQLLSSPEVASDYRLIYEGENARDAELKNNYQIDPQILSIVLNNSNGVKIATTRLKLKIFNKSTQGIVEKIIVVTLSYDYFLESIREQDRLDNPLGFKVLNYRVDEEIVR